MNGVYKFIKFISANKDGIPMWLCQNKKHGDTLGYCFFYRPWKQWVFSAESSAVFSVECLNDVTDYIAYLNTMVPAPQKS
jgi:hypothetical protein